MADLFTVEQIDYLDKHFDDRYNDEFVHTKDCNDIQTRNNKRFATDDKRIEKQEEFNAGLKKLGWVIVSILASETLLNLLSLLKDVV